MTALRISDPDAGHSAPRTMAELSTLAPPAPLLSTRKIVHMSMLSFAFLLPYLTWQQAAGCALLALVFNVVILPRMEVDLRKGTGREGVWTGIVVYPVSVLALILLYRHDLYIVATAWAIMALGDGMASVVGRALRGPALPWNAEKTWSGFAGFIAAGTLGAYVLLRWTAAAMLPGFAWRLAAAAALVGALVESLPIRLDDNASVPLVVGAFVFCMGFVERSAWDSNLPYLGRRVLLAVVVNLTLAALALALKMVTPSGAVCGFLLGVAVYMGYGYKSFLMMFGFFVLGSMATRFGYARKAARGVAEKRGGARNYRQALANSLAGAFFSILVIATHREAAFLMALIAAFAEAAGDTVASEIGQWASNRAYMVTTFKPVRAGEDGGVSLAGSLAGLAASALIVALGWRLGICGRAGATIALSAAAAGNLFDSLLGATLQRRGLLTNNTVNFAGTSFAGGLALGIALHVGF